MKDLVNITEKEFDVTLDLRYASENNICAQKLYTDPICYLHKDAAELLEKAVKSAKELGLKLKIFDGFRPSKSQKFMFNKFPSTDSQPSIFSNPETGSVPHCRGVAIDLTLTDLKGNELEMGTDFDDFSDLAFHSCQKVSVTARYNRLILLGIMTAAGFDFYAKEWWHYQLFKAREYPVSQDNSLSSI